MLSLELLCIASAALVIGFSKTSGGGLVMLAIPLMALAFPGKDSTGLMLPLMVAADLLAAAYYRRNADWRLIGRFFPLAALGVVLGFLLMEHLSDRLFNLLFGSLILALLALHHFAGRLAAQLPESRLYTVLIGLLLGLTTMLSNAAGPLMSLFFLQSGLGKSSFVGTRGWFFLVVNLFKLPFSWQLGLITPHSLLLNLSALPWLLGGAWLGIRLLGRLDEKGFQRFIHATTLLAALGMLYKALAA